GLMKSEQWTWWSLGCDVDNGRRVIARTTDTLRSARHAWTTPIPAVPVEPKTTATYPWFARSRVIAAVHSRTAISVGLLLRVPPAPDCNDRPDRLDDAEWPGTLKEAVSRAERTGDGKREHELDPGGFARAD